MTPPLGIVTGAGGAIGRAIALRLASDGMDLVATDLDAVALDETLKFARGLPGSIAGTAGDLLDTGLAPRLVEQARERGMPTLLVNCAGLLRDSRISKTPVEQFRRMIDVNLLGSLRMIAAMVPALKQAGGGRIISLASRAWLGNFGSAGYSAAKGGLVGATRSLALELAPYGILVNCVAPGFIDTPMGRSLPSGVLERVVSAIPVGRKGTVDDVSAMVGFLAGPDSGYITGQTLILCGGRSISDPIVSVAGKEKS